MASNSKQAAPQPNDSVLPDSLARDEIQQSAPSQDGPATQVQFATQDEGARNTTQTPYVDAAPARLDSINSNIDRQNIVHGKRHRRPVIPSTQNQPPAPRARSNVPVKVKKVAVKKVATGRGKNVPKPISKKDRQGPRKTKASEGENEVQNENANDAVQGDERPVTPETMRHSIANLVSQSLNVADNFAVFMQGRMGNEIEATAMNEDLAEILWKKGTKRQPEKEEQVVGKGIRSELAPGLIGLGGDVVMHEVVEAIII
ncbi:uncharacterized protein K460DRAFT_418933 [Cucurbitaria berberidis CBS 394.84]|uniref:Uncharacterized protein n=1 Tax=Cucurbitaria berberidis CBS 394.84 TaxID=1168544 RepID=A0A9P4L750_9PLEO|nr:uncharacterized protein K460DRAFT_418933 [Cucurbitaria berberidis CBS 394.84]KAF1843952.1 hypothetical protein K460DRAFT_418933 [Cucurbitaria berberidis CBS 394.84]